VSGFFVIVTDVSSVHSFSQRYQRLYESMPDSVVLINKAGNVIGFNQKALMQYGYGDAEMMALSILDFEAEEDLARVVRHKRSIIESGRDHFLTRHRTKTGRVIEVEADVCLVDLPDGESIFQCVFHDIGEMKAREAALRLAEERLELALDSAEEGMWDWNIQSGELVTSPQWSLMLGYQPGEIGNDVRAWEALCHPLDLPEARTRLEAHFTGLSDAYEFEHRLRHKSGTWIWVLGKAKVVGRDAEGKPLRIVGTNVNITRRKEIEARLHSESSKREAIFKAASDGLHIMDEQGNLVEYSDSFCRMLGYSREEMAGMNIIHWDREMGKSCLPFHGRLANLPESGTIIDAWHVRKDGTEYEAEIGVIRIAINGEQYVYASARDVSARKQTEGLLRDREARLSAIFDNLPYMIWFKDTGGSYVTANQRFILSAGKNTANEIHGKSDFDLWPRELAEKYRQDDFEVMSARKQKFVEELSIDGGKSFWVETFKTPVIDESGELLGTTGFARDITERKTMELSLQIAGMIYQCSAEAMMVTDADNLIVDVNPAFTQLTGFTLDEISGKNPRIFKSGLHDAAYYEAMWSDLIATGHWRGEIWDRKKGGELHAKLLTINTVKDKSGKTEKYVGLFSDITEKKKAEELVLQQATIDTLTQLPNRRLFRDRLEQELKVASRNKSPLTLMFIDLDRFKQINDTFGHEAGDKLLVEAARRICSCVRATDTVARIGGDEFVAILPGVNERAYIERISAGIIEMLVKPFILDKDSGYISASIGIATCTGDLSADNILKRADIAMYAAKQAGRSGYKFFEDIGLSLSQE